MGFHQNTKLSLYYRIWTVYIVLEGFLTIGKRMVTNHVEKLIMEIGKSLMKECLCKELNYLDREEKEMIQD